GGGAHRADPRNADAGRPDPPGARPAGNSVRMARRGPRDAPGAAAVDELLHGAGGFGLLDELVDVSEPIRLALRHNHAVDIRAVAVRKHAGPGELRREVEQNEAGGGHSIGVAGPPWREGLVARVGL